MLKKLIVAVLACLTIFLSKRALSESPAHAGHAPRVQSTGDVIPAVEAAPAMKTARTAVLF